ncbi:hypothetical protein BDR26DRAFT_935920 [Obelidium mucronatum]|nr:hypothetical protein BDR26DRAFT_935920 [Obelidium mucronatum]
MATNVLAFLPSILANIPSEWRGTTFANTALLGREEFASRITALTTSSKTKTTVTEADLIALGTAEDYLRVSSNMSVLLELVLASAAKLPVKNVFSFGSTTMPFISVLLTAKEPVVIQLPKGVKSPFTAADISTLKLLGANFIVEQGEAKSHPGKIVIALQETLSKTTPQPDAVVSQSVLYIHTNRINPDDILVIRKRLSTPLTTPACERILQRIAGVKITADLEASTPASVAEFYEHLQTMSGTTVDTTANPVIFTAGLPAVCSLWLGLLKTGGADILMASTAYGGSSQLTDIFASRTTGNSPAKFTKSTFDITGKNDISTAIENALAILTKTAKTPTTVLFVEIPTNPDMKVPNMPALAQLLQSYAKTTGKQVLLLVDTTFAPASQVIKKISSSSNVSTPDVTSMVFISMSKSVSRGYTTAGAIVADSTSPKSRALLEQVRSTAALLDTTAKKDQIWRLTQNHVGVESRCDKAYIVAAAVGTALTRAVSQYANGYSMELAFVTPEQAAEGFTTSTFSFNLPPLNGVPAEVNKALAQRFVDLLTVERRLFKPCVSFGQDNGLVYATVPATSTQGAIKEEDKAKQLVGGVELTRLSFAANCNVRKVIGVIESAVKTIYSKSTTQESKL